MKFWNFGRTAEPAPAPLAPAEQTRTRTLLSVRRAAARMFKAANVMRTDKWETTPTTPDEFISRQQRVLVARSRHQWANNDYVRNFVRLVRQNVVGPQGIILQAQAQKTRGGKLDKPLNDAIEAAWEEWSKGKNCDVTGKRSLWKIQRLVMNTTARDGEFIIRKVYGADAGPWGFALQLIDPQRLPPDYDVSRLKNGGFIRHGIEFNRYGRAVAYHFGSDDESDSQYYHVSGRGYIRIPADEIIHGFLEEMVGQRRGLPWSSTSLFRLHHLAGFENAAVQNARASASKMGFIEYADGFGPECEDDEGVEIDAEPLSFHELPQGAKIAEWNPQYPSGEFAVFNKAMLRGAAAGWGVAYNNVAGDLEGVNFSSIRQGTLDERDHYKDLQQWLIETLMQEIYDEWLPRALLSNRILVANKPVPASKLDACKQISWQGRRWQWIDPTADVKAAVESKNNLLASPGQIIRESGRDPQTVWQESARDVRAMIDAYVAEGIPEAAATEMVMLAMAPGRLPTKAGEKPADNQPDTKKAPE
ncbi:phage portal protein [Microvirga sp. 17 mud 1-3]|uniref:phage portal protein n=1 Tax=Microvirga sp. 17 mud 1-3 TaxID=2082949 RepID=UPI000D6CD937|nr:phage portal protein [Microvirga sp. 17 mud 1-3]AWM87367.1 phage portal protein [Microvirga sp. 17 mud 1-3]